MVRYTLLLIVLSAATLGAQATAKQPWIGTIEFTDATGLSVGRMTADLLLGGTSFAGEWISRRGASGRVWGTIEKDARIKGYFTITAPGGEVINGREVITAPERCQGESAVEGQLLPSGVLRVTASRIKTDTPSLRALDKHCADMTRVVILLQPHEH